LTVCLAFPPTWANPSVFLVTWTGPVGTKIDEFPANRIGKGNFSVKVAQAFANCGVGELKALLDGGTLTVYSVARPPGPDIPVDRSGVLAAFTFASPAFDAEKGGLERPAFAENPVAAKSVGTPGFARACKADGTVVADFSAGPGDREIKFDAVSCSHGAPIAVKSFKFMPEGTWPEKPEYFETRPRSGFPLPRNP
jgi:hypothetical protein